MAQLFDLLEEVFFTNIFGQINLYTILSTLVKFLFILIVLVYIARIVRMISMDIRSSYHKAPANAALLKLLDDPDHFDFPIRDTYYLSDNTTIGRADDNNIILKSRMISKYQALLQDREGAHYIEDLGATNPTLVNGKAIQGPTPLSSRDMISMAGIDFMFIEGDDDEG